MAFVSQKTKYENKPRPTTKVVVESFEEMQEFNEDIRVPIKGLSFVDSNAAIWAPKNNREQIEKLLDSKQPINCTLSMTTGKDGRVFVNLNVVGGEQSPSNSTLLKLQKWQEFPGTAHYDWLTGYVGLSYDQIYDLVLTGKVVPLKNGWFALDDEYVKRCVRKPSPGKLSSNLKDFKEVYYDRNRAN
ncbi:MAG: hypothetical protein HY512_03865 [Candidatus Aenigmarchaeota archaeon]|nr:hypothetical protein [Candidatus Aenigmarchaeota archaeon]